MLNWQHLALNSVWVPTFVGMTVLKLAVNVLVETYKGNFSSEINKTGIDGLIGKLADRNKQLAGKPLAAPAK